MNSKNREIENEELLHKKLMFQSLFDSSPDAIAILDETDRVVEINPAFAALFNYSPGEAKGQLINDLIDIEKTEPLLMSMLSGFL